MSKPLLTCRECEKPMFPVESYNDRVSCPLCYRNAEAKSRHFYCKNCKIVFEKGCLHMENKEAEDYIYNAALMDGFAEDGRGYQGMLVFDSDQKAEEFLNKSSIAIIFRCTCTGSSHLCSTPNFPQVRGPCTFEDFSPH